MTFIPVPGTAVGVMSGKIGTQPWAVVTHWRPGSSTAPWTQSDADLLAQRLAVNWTAMQGNIPTNVSLIQASVVDLTNSSGVGSVFVNTTPLQGTLSGTLEPASACSVARCVIPARYRGGHPRIFWPGASVTQMKNEFQWTDSFTLSIGNGTASWVTAIRTAAYSFGTGVLNHVIPRYTYTYTNDPVKHKYVKTRNTLLETPVVTQYFGMQTMGSQRRRLRN